MFSSVVYRFLSQIAVHKGIFGGAAILACVSMVVAPASADMILADFGAQPTSPGVYELVWNHGELYEGSGAIGSGFMTSGAGDGEQPVDHQAAPGLLVQTPFLITGISSGEINSLSAATAFYDATLDIIPISGTYGLPSAGDVVVTSLPGGVSIFTQPLGSARFAIWSTDPLEAVGDIENPTLLLSGIINNAAIVGILGSSTGAALSADVTYTGGAILNAAAGEPLDGEFSWSLLNATPTFAVDPTTGLLVEFDANATGQFTTSAVPEPSTLVLLCLGGLALLGHAWCKR